MVKIPLKHGQFLLVDEVDIPLVNRYSWVAHNNRSRGNDHWQAVARARKADGTPTTVALHRLIMNARPGDIVDHKDGNSLNNTRDNLRLATKAQNNRNQRARDSQRFKGVFPNTGCSTWTAAISFQGKKRYLGSYADPVEAAKAYDNAARELFGEFASLNFPDGG